MKRQEVYKAERTYKELEKQAKALRNATSTEELAEMEERSRQIMASEIATKKQRLSGTTNEDESDGSSDSLDLDLDDSSSSEEEDAEVKRVLVNGGKLNSVTANDRDEKKESTKCQKKNRIDASVKPAMTSIQYTQYFACNLDGTTSVKEPKDVYQLLEPAEIVSNNFQHAATSSSSSTSAVSASLTSKQTEIFSKLFRTCYGSKNPQISKTAAATICNPQLKRFIWFPSIDEINASLEFFKAADCAYFQDSDTSTSHMKRNEPDDVHMKHNLKNWLKALTALLDRYCVFKSSNFEYLNSSIFQQVLYAVALLNGFDHLSNVCGDFPRKCLDSLLKVASPQILWRVSTQKVFERIISREQHTLPMLLAFADTLLNISSNPQFCGDFCILVLQRLHECMPREVALRLQEMNLPNISLFDALKETFGIFIEACKNEGFAGEYFEALLYTIRITCVAFLLRNGKMNGEEDEYKSKISVRTKYNEEWRPIIKVSVPTLLKYMKDPRGKANYKLIPQVENLVEATQMIYDNQQGDSSYDDANEY